MAGRAAGRARRAVCSLGGSRTTVVDPVTVVDAPITGISSAPITTVAGTTFTGTVVNFSQYNLTPAAVWRKALPDIKVALARAAG